MKLYLLVLGQVIMLVTGQTLWKIGIDRFNGLTKDNFLQCVFSLPVLGGLFIYVMATFLWFYIISIARDRFSMVYPLGSLAYVLGVFVAFFFFKETIPYTRWIGITVVVIGVILIGKQ